MGELARVKRLQVVDAFAHADGVNGQGVLGGYGNEDAATGGAVELGHDEAGDAGAPHDVLLVLDATTGQNALSQVDVFRDRAGVTGLIMTKLDGTARGGILVAISAKHALPVHAIGVGEGIDDLQPFDAGEFAQAIAGS